MNAEENHYLKKLKNLQKCVQSKLELGKLNNRNYIGLASWDKKTKTFKLHQILKSSKYHVNHIEVDSIDKLEDLKQEKDTKWTLRRYNFTRLPFCVLLCVLQMEKFHPRKAYEIGYAFLL